MNLIIQDDTAVDYAVLTICSVQAKYEYVAKIVCGQAVDTNMFDDFFGHRLEPGSYSTTVNLYNHGDHRAYIAKYLALSSPPGLQVQGGRYQLTGAPDILDSGHALEASCEEIALKRQSSALNIATTYPDLYIEGYVVIQSTQPLTAKAVYTTSGVSCYFITFFGLNICWPQTGAHSGMEVENVEERQI